MWIRQPMLVVCMSLSLQVVLCVVWAGGMLGVAYYTVETGYLHVMEDAAEREDFGLLRRSECSTRRGRLCRAGEERRMRGRGRERYF